MLTIKSFFLRPPIPLVSISGIPYLHPRFSLKPQLRIPYDKARSRFLRFAQTNNIDDNNNLTQEPKEQEQEQEQENRKGSTSNGGGGNGNDVGDDLKKGQRPLFDIKWGDLLLDPDPDNIIAVGLTGLLTWASVQVLWQLFVISLAILVAALKYSFIAALLIFILITLL